MKKQTIRFWPFALLLFIILMVACGARTDPQPIPTPKDDYFPSSEWRVSRPEEQDVDPELLDEMVEKIEENYWDVDNITIIRHGYKIFDVSLGSYQAGDLHLLFSCTKSVVSALIGIAIDQGHIEGVDLPLTELFAGKEIKNLDSRKQAITLKHLLSMTAGFKCRDSYKYQFVGLIEMGESEDWIQHVLDLPMEYQPGTHFEYCNGISNLLSAIVQNSTGVNTAEFAEQYLFSPLGIEEYLWEQDPSGIPLGYSWLYLKPADMARIGYLYLRGGNWAGQQIVSSEWVDDSTSLKVIAETLQDGYGYQWWIDADGYYMALGYAGQFIFVLPEYDLVAVFVSDPEVGDFNAPEYLLTNHIIPAVEASQ